VVKSSCLSSASYHHQLPLPLLLPHLASMESAQPVRRGKLGTGGRGRHGWRENAAPSPAAPPPPLDAGDLTAVTAPSALDGESAVLPSQLALLPPSSTSLLPSPPPLSSSSTHALSPCKQTRKATKQRCELDLLRDRYSDDEDSMVLSPLSSTAYSFAVLVANAVAPTSASTAATVRTYLTA
jgi:hypothetical protein